MPYTMWIIILFVILQIVQVLKLIFFVFGSAAIFHVIAVLFGASITEYDFFLFFSWFFCFFFNCDVCMKLCMHAMLGTPSTCKSKIGNGCREKDF